MKFAKKTIWLGILFILLLSAAGCIALRAPSANGGPTGEVVPVSRGPLSVTINAIGNIRSAQNVSLSWQTSGKVGQVMATVGQKVSVEETLAVLDPTSLPNTILQAQVDLINAQNAIEDLQNPDPFSVVQAEDALRQAQEALDALLKPSSTALAQAELAILNAQDVVDDAQYKLTGINKGRGNAQQIELARANYLLALDKVEAMKRSTIKLPANPKKTHPKPWR